MRFLALLVALLLLWAAILAGVRWLGLPALSAPRLIDAPPRLVLRGEAAPGRGAAELRTALRAAGMHADGAEWRLQDAAPAREATAPVHFAIEMRAEDTRKLARMPAQLRAARLGGEAALVLDLPDRGAVTRALVLPLARSRLADRARALDAEIVARRLRSGDGMLELQWVLERHPRGRAAPDPRAPRLEAPRLPSGPGAARGGR